jgi:signal transduction histidine kinase
MTPLHRLGRTNALARASVRVRITAATVLIVAAALVLGALALVTLLQRDTLRAVRTDAQVRAAEVAALALKAPLPRPLPAIVGDRPTLLQVVDRSGVITTASAPIIDRAVLGDVSRHDSGRGQQIKLTLENVDSSWLVHSVSATVTGQSVTVVVATSLEELQRTTNRLEKLLTIGLPLLVMAAAVAAWTLVGRALTPVERLRTAVNSLALDGSAVRGERVAEPTSHDEISRLAQTLNLLLDRVESSALIQRRFVADASHELRGPIANIRVAIEVAQAHPDRADWGSISDEVLAQDERMSRLVDHLLMLARNDDDPTRRHRESFDLAHLVSDAVTTAQASDPATMRGGRPLAIRVHHLNAAALNDDRTQLMSVVSNLIDNAMRFATTTVTVSLVTSGGWTELTVSDDGPGVPVDDRDRIFDRFYRVDEHRSRQGGGAGLGLAIVARLVSERGGFVSVADARPGAVFTVRLPLRRVVADPRSAAGGPSQVSLR